MHLKINTYFLKEFVRLLLTIFFSSNLLLERSLQFRGFYHLLRDIFLNGLKLNETVQNGRIFLSNVFTFLKRTNDDSYFH